jgi:hypothetical protein
MRDGRVRVESTVDGTPEVLVKLLATGDLSGKEVVEVDEHGTGRFARLILGCPHGWTDWLDPSLGRRAHGVRA